MYYDLDAADMPERFLIKPQDPHFQQNVRHLRVCIDEREPRLTFILSFSAASPRTETYSPKTQLWKVGLVGHGANAHLSAQPIVHIQSDDQGLITSLAIRGDTLARAVFRIGCVHIEIYDWTRVTESKCQRALIFLDNRPRYISILPGNRLLVLVPERLLIYVIPMLEEATTGDWIPVEAHTKPLFDLPFYSRGIGAFGVSRPLISIHAICFVVCSQESVYSLEIFHETGCPQFSLLALFQNEDETIFGGGFEKIFVQRSRSVATISLDWNLEPSAKIVSVNHTFPTKRKMYAPIFDEESGRILQITDSTVAVVDTANCFV